MRRIGVGSLAVGLCLVALFGAAWVSTAVFDRLPHVEDEVAFLFQARTIAAGGLVAAAPARPEFFDIPFVLVRDGQWFGKYPPGYPIVLALGVLVGQPWLVNPLFGALSVGLIYVVGRRLYGASVGLLAAALVAFSPFFLLQAGSFMSHAVCLFWAMAFLLLFVIAWERRSRGVALVAGAALGALLLSRPLTAVGIGLPFALWALVDTVGKPQRVPVYLSLAIGFLPFVAVLAAYNYATTGDPVRSAYEVWWPYDRIGFGTGFGLLGSHTLEDGMLNTRLNLEDLAEWLFGWPGRLSLLPAAIAVEFALLGLAGRFARRLRVHSSTRSGVPKPPERDPAWREDPDSTGGRLCPPGGGGALAPLRDPAGANSKGNRSRPEVNACASDAKAFPELWDLLVVGMVGGLMAVHIAYWAPGQMYGPRYYFEALGALALLSARGLLQTAAMASEGLQLAFGGRRWPRALAAGATLAVVAWLVVQNLTGFAPRQFAHFTRWYNVDGEGLRLVGSAGLQNAIVFVKQSSWTDYAPFFSQNAPSLDSNVVYAIDLGADENRKLMALFPGRSFFRYADGRLVPLAER
ncbi:MAG: glycosyltransferase family 39 protein [Chloroflexi bacterium]|nr:glycosyltransferase family 39 protein [Chloroflexota bacterium]